jgi:hypothetical protein
MNQKTFHFRHALDYWAYRTEWTYEKENRFWHFNTTTKMKWWWDKQSPAAKYFAMRDFSWHKVIRREGVRGTHQLFGNPGARSQLSAYGSFFYIHGTLKAAVRNLYLHTLSLIRYYEAADRINYLRQREMKQPGFLIGSHVVRAAMVQELDNFTRHMQATVAFGEGYLDMWVEFAKCYAEFSKTADALSDSWRDEGFMHSDIDWWKERHARHTQFQTAVNWGGRNRADGGKLHWPHRIQGIVWDHYFGGGVTASHKGVRGLYHLMPQAFDHGQGFMNTPGEWNRSGDAKHEYARGASEPRQYAFLLKFQFGPLGNKEKFMNLFSDFYFMENFNRGMARRAFQRTQHLGDLAERVYRHQRKEGLDPMLADYVKHLSTLTVLAERRMFRSRVPDDRE